MTRDELITLLMTYWPNGTDDIPRVRRGNYDYFGAGLQRRPGSVPLVAPDDPDARQRCGDCGALEGSLHLVGCDMERCGLCGRQYSSCDCQRQADTPRVPYIDWPVVCARCGELWPIFFQVPDAEWRHYIQTDRRREVLCHPCYERIQTWIDTGALRPPPTGFSR